MQYIAVFDTNVLFSGIGWRGNPYRCLELARAGVIEGITCAELLDELEEKLSLKLGFTADSVQETITDLLGFLRLAEITNTLKVVSADPDDDKVIECAVVAGATHIITGDRRHLLPLVAYQGVSIVSAAEFLSVVTVG